jgi:toxin ParE1/3/4
VTAYRLLSLPSALANTDEAFEWYENERDGLGQEFLESMRAAYDRIASGPLSYQEMRAGLRRILLRRFPYAVYFAVEGEVVTVVTVLHVSRHPRGWQRAKR